MAHYIDYLIDQVKNSWVEDNEGSANTAETQTHNAETGRHHVFLKCDASFSSSTASGLLQIKFGTTVVMQKYIHGAGAIDAGDLGFQNATINSLISATLAAGGSGVTGTVTLTGYSTGPNA